MDNNLYSLSILHGIALNYQELGYKSYKELSSLLVRDLYVLRKNLEENGIEPINYQIFHNFIGSTPKQVICYDYPGGLIGAALEELLSTFGIKG